MHNESNEFNKYIIIPIGSFNCILEAQIAIKQNKNNIGNTKDIYQMWFNHKTNKYQVFRKTLSINNINERKIIIKI